MILHYTVILRYYNFEKNAHTSPELSSSGQNTLSTFILANLLLKHSTTAKSIYQLI